MRFAPTAALLAASLGLAACSDGNPERRRPAKPPETTLTPLSAPEIRAALPGHMIGDRSGHCYHAPLLIHPNARFESRDLDTGYSEGKYAIREGRVEFDNGGAPDGLRFAMELYRDAAGRLYAREPTDPPRPRPLVLLPPDGEAFDKAAAACAARLLRPATPAAGG